MVTAIIIAMDTKKLLLMEIMMIMLTLMDTDMVTDIIMKSMCIKPLRGTELDMRYPPSMTLTRSCLRRFILMRDSCNGFQPDGKLTETMS